MIDPQHVFVADAKPALALPARRVAYVFGAASALGEAVLNQVLASPAYTQVFVQTSTTLPGSVAHLTGFLAQQTLVLDEAAQQFDCVFVLNQAQTVKPRHSVYAPLLPEALPEALRVLAAQLHTRQARFLIVAPDLAAAQASTFLASYAPHAPCMVYGLAQGAASSARQQAYQFKPQADTMLDRLGAWVLNTLSQAAHGMLNPDKQAPLTAVKTAQRVMQRFAALPAQVSGAVSTLSPSDLTVL